MPAIAQENASIGGVTPWTAWADLPNEVRSVVWGRFFKISAWVALGVTGFCVVLALFMSPNLKGPGVGIAVGICALCLGMVAVCLIGCLIAIIPLNAWPATLTGAGLTRVLGVDPKALSLNRVRPDFQRLRHALPGLLAGLPMAGLFVAAEYLFTGHVKMIMPAVIMAVQPIQLTTRAGLIRDAWKEWSERETAIAAVPTPTA